MEQQQQSRFATKRSTLHVSKKPAGGKGHDLILRALQESGRNIHVYMSSGEVIHGRVVGRDKFTITVLVTRAGETSRHVVYKHAIDKFVGEEQPAEQKVQ